MKKVYLERSGLSIGSKFEYKVVKTTNTLEPEVGTYLDKKAVQVLMEDIRNIEVVITKRK